MKARAYGCEFEFSTEWDEAEPVIRGAIGARKLVVEERRCRSINNYKWHMKKDGTTEYELASPVSRDGDLARICSIIGRLSRKLKVTRVDGFHVHVQARDVDKRVLVAAWLRLESAMTRIVPRWRRSAGFCFAVGTKWNPVADELKGAMEQASDHHAACSTKYYDELGTVEFRLCEGTTSPKVVRAWTRLCLAFVEYAKRCDVVSLLCGKCGDMTFDDMVLEMDPDLDEEDVGVLRSRRNKFK